jgi:hypothetical protein
MKLHLFVILLFSFLFNKSLSAQAVDFSLSSYNIVIAENNQSSYTTTKNISVFLNTMPSSNVTISFNPSIFEQFTITPTQLDFDPGNWNIPQIIKITAINDDIVEQNPTVTVVNVTSSITIHDSGSGDGSHDSGSGDGSHDSGSGDGSHDSGSGDGSHDSGSGDGSHDSGSGDGSHDSGSGDGSHDSGSGDGSHDSGSGDGSHDSGSGDGSHDSGSGDGLNDGSSTVYQKTKQLIVNVFDYLNNAPTASAGSITTTEDTAGTLDLSTLSSDVDGDTLTFTVTDPSKGTVTLADGVVTYTPTSDYNGDDSFTYTVGDGTETATGAVSVTVTAVNDAPTASAGSIATTEDTAGTLDLSTLSSDVDGDTLTFTVTDPSNGTVTLLDGVVTYTPTSDYNGDDSFTYTVGDGTETATGAVSVTVTAVNDAPTASAGSIATTEDTAGTLDLSTLSSDVDGDTLTFTVTDPSNGTVTLLDGVVTYTPTSDYNGDDSFTYTVGDKTKTTIDYTISVTINSINDIPTSGPTAVTIEEDTIVDIDISELISDVEDDALTVVIDTNPTQGNVSLIESNVSLIETGFKYIPKADYSGTDAFTYFVVDSEGAKSNISEVKITVNDVNDAPIASDINSSTNQDTALILTVDVSDKDTESANLELVIDQGPSKGQITVDGFNIKYIPDSSYSGVDSFTYYVLDTTDLSVSDIYTVDITVLEVEQILDKNPTVASLEVNGEQDKELQFTLQGTDPSSLELIYEISSAPLNGTVTIEENKAIYIPAAGYFGEDSFSYSAINIDQLASNIGKVSITVYEKQNNAPAAYNDRVSVFIGETVSFDLNGNDPEGNTLTYLLEDSTNLDSNVVLNSSTGVATVTHSGIVGEETFTFVVNDGLTNSEVATVTILGIQKPNNRPFVRNKLLKLKRKLGLSYNLTLAGNLNVSDADGFNTLSEFEATNLPSFITSVEHAFISTTSTLKITNNISFESSEMYPSTSTFEYTVKDEQGLSSIPGQISIYIDEVEINNPPKSYGYSIPMPSNNTVKLLGYDEDLDSIAFEITEVTNASIENIAPDNGSGWSVAYVKFVRTNDENGVSISYKVNDGTDSSSISTITLN